MTTRAEKRNERAEFNKTRDGILFAIKNTWHFSSMHR